MSQVAGLIAEIVAVAGVFLLAVSLDLRVRAPLCRASRLFHALGRRPLLSIVVVAAVSLVISVTISLIKFPLPWVHDEFSYLLAADTFASGRVTNPPHPMWMHFETFHVLMQPTYASKYFPAQGLLLALGQLLWHPVLGVWVGTAMAAALSCWMLQGWLPGRWALFGGLIVACHPFIQTSWGQNYWGGQVAMIGGALVFGALPRVVRHRRVVDSLTLALGAVILANSRPFEGLFASLIPAVAVLLWLVGPRRPTVRRGLTHVILPVGAVFACAAAAMGYYNWRVTGQALTTPYQVHQVAYHTTPAFLWQDDADEPEYRHQELRDFYLNTASDSYYRQRTISEVIAVKGPTLFSFWLILLRVVLTVPLLLLPRVLSDRRFVVPFVSVLLVVGASLGGQWLNPHYLAPVFPAGLLLLMAGFRRLRSWRVPNRSTGRILVRGLLTMFLIGSVAQSASYLREPYKEFATSRVRVTRQLKAMPGRHLVVVRYEPGRPLQYEWVYNRAEIDLAKVVWAREMSPEQNRRLLEYFDDRQVWLLEADAETPRLTRYIQ
jgi:hypothetical protein